MARSYAIPIAIALIACIQAAMCAKQTIPDARDFFAKRIAYRMNVTWAHRVNSKAQLDAAMSNNKTMMLEADVVLGNHTIGNVTTENVAIMAHPPNATSDLSLDQFLTTVLAKKNQGIKLDFKSYQAFTASRDILEAHRKNMTVPVWLNADILPGPVVEAKQNADPVDASKFLLGASSTVPASTLSIGWTTVGPDGKYNANASYTEADMKAMVKAIADNEIHSTITYPVRAVLAVYSEKVLKELMKNTTANKPTLTIWTAEGDVIDDKALSTFIKAIGLDKVYLDLPDDIKAKLDIHPGAKGSAPSSAASSLMLVGSVIASFAIAKLF